MIGDAYTAALAAYRGWTYGPLDDAGEMIECCALTALVIEQAVGWPRDWDWWDDMMVLDPERLWSPVTATADRLDSAAVLPHHGPYRPMPGRWSLVQGWRQRGTGHQVLWRAHDEDAWMGWVWESSSVGGMGPCVRGLRGREPLHRVVDEDGDLLVDIEPIDFGELLHEYDDGIAWVELPRIRED